MSKKPTTKKASAGERIVVANGYVDSLFTLRASKQIPQHRGLAKSIDALVRKAVREAYMAGKDDQRFSVGEYGKVVSERYRTTL